MTIYPRLPQKIWRQGDNKYKPK